MRKRIPVSKWMEAMSNVLIAVDSRPLIGAGHVGRVLAIAEELKKRDYPISWFVSDSHNFLNLLSFFQVGSEILNGIQINQIQGSPVDYLVIDSYDEFFMQEVAQLCHPRLIVQIVDETSPALVSASIRWSGSILSENAKKRLGKGCHLFSGLQFVPLRNQVKELRNSNLFSPRKEKDSIIVTLGASDRAIEIIDKVADIIRALPFSQDVFISHPKYEKTFESENFKFLDPRDMLAKASKHDSLVICGGGITALELLFLRLDFLVAEVADNQVAQIDYLCKNKLAEKLGLIDSKQDTEILWRGLSSLTIKNYEENEGFGQGSSLFVDWIDRNCPSETNA
jgi:spore coat polysaccharide biosynthesis predicted glycosyltransferase SpsG